VRDASIVPDGRRDVDALAEADFERYFRARRDAIRRTAYLMCGDWHHAAR